VPGDTFGPWKGGRLKPRREAQHSRATAAGRNSGLPASALVEVGSNHRLAEPEPLAAMLRACESE
jgi:hypothetical protein